MSVIADKDEFREWLIVEAAVISETAVVGGALVRRLIVDLLLFMSDLLPANEECDDCRVGKEFRLLP
jgi:hypothetical protein